MKRVPKINHVRLLATDRDEDGEDATNRDWDGSGPENISSLETRLILLLG